MERLRKKLGEVKSALERERKYAGKVGGRGNQEVIKALDRRAGKIQSKMRKLAEELRSYSGSKVMTRPASVSSAMSVSPIKSRGVAKGSISSLARAARVALRKGRFKSASEKAVFGKIVSDLIDGGYELQLHVLERLGELKSPAALPIFAAGCRHPNENVRVAALRGVLAMREPSTQHILTDALSDPSHRVRVWAIRGLYALDVPFLGELLCGRLADLHPSVRRAAATYLSWKQVPGAEQYLIRRLHDDSLEVRIAVISALGQCGSDACVFKLIQSQKDESEPVREAAAASLEKILGVVPQMDLESDQEGRKKGVQELVAWWREERVRRLIDSSTEPRAADDDETGDRDLASEPHEVVETHDGEIDDDGLAVQAADEAGGALESELDADGELEGELEDVGGGFLTAEETSEAKE